MVWIVLNKVINSPQVYYHKLYPSVYSHVKSKCRITFEFIAKAKHNEVDFYIDLLDTKSNLKGSAI